MASASDPPAHPALQPADRLILPPLPPRAAVETSIGPPHYPAESTQSHAFVQPSLRARKGHANSDSLGRKRFPVRVRRKLGRKRLMVLPVLPSLSASERSRRRVFPSRAREETRESRGVPCLFLNTERGFGGKPPKKSGFRRHLAGSKMLKRRFSWRSPVGE